jgi:hypothetical protein
MILWRIDPLLGKGLETDNETTAVAVQRRGKHAFITLELLLATYFLLDPRNGIILKTVGATRLVVSSVLHGRLWSRCQRTADENTAGWKKA